MCVCVCGVGEIYLSQTDYSIEPKINFETKVWNMYSFSLSRPGVSLVETGNVWQIKGNYKSLLACGSIKIMWLVYLPVTDIHNFGLKNDIDVICLQETKDVKGDALKLNGYRAYHLHSGDRTQCLYLRQKFYTFWTTRDAM